MLRIVTKVYQTMLLLMHLIRIIRDRNMLITYNYRGADFQVSKQRSFGSRPYTFKIKSLLQANVKDLHLPQDYNFTTLDDEYDLVAREDLCYFRDVEQSLINPRFPMVERLYIPSNVSRLNAINTLFPNLKEIIVAPTNSNYKAYNTFLERNRELVFVFSAGLKDECIVPKEIHSIGHNAFSYTKCKRITFEDPSITIANDAFSNSYFLDRNDQDIIIGKTYYRFVKANDHKIEIPDFVTGFDINAFERIPRDVDTLVSPKPVPKLKLGDLPNTITKIEITRITEKLQFNTLALFTQLKEIELAPNELYDSIDGIIFSKDKKTLHFFPTRGPANYIIPEGTEIIAPFAFKNNQNLKSITMPNSIKVIGNGAFYGCKDLEQITFSENITSLPNATDFCPYGVFEECRQLREITLPSSLRYIGSYAFHETRIEEIIIPEGVEHIGEFAFASYDHSINPVPLLKRAVLPASLQTISRGSISGCQKVYAFEGTAYGLICAIGSKYPDHNKYVNSVIWNPSEIYIKNQDKVISVLKIPGSLASSSRSTLDIAWNNVHFDFDLYQDIFEDTTDGCEKQDIAASIVLADSSDKTGMYQTYLKRVGSKHLVRLIENGSEEIALRLVKICNYTSTTLKLALECARKSKMTNLSAFVLEILSKQSNSKKALKL